MCIIEEEFCNSAKNDFRDNDLSAQPMLIYVYNQLSPTLKVLKKSLNSLLKKGTNPEYKPWLKWL